MAICSWTTRPVTPAPEQLQPSPRGSCFTQRSDSMQRSQPGHLTAWVTTNCLATCGTSLESQRHQGWHFVTAPSLLLDPLRLATLNTYPLWLTIAHVATPTPLMSACCDEDIADSCSACLALQVKKACTQLAG
eukprot:356630-Chlamydomonas_euryale.AAC.4